MTRPDPQYGVQLSVADIPLELPIYPIYGVTPSDKYIPIQVNEDGQLSIGNVTITGPVTVNDVVIKGVDPDNGNTSEDVSVVNWGIHGYALRTSIFYQGNALLVNPDGSININPTEVLPVQIDHNTDSVAIYGTDGTSNTFIKTDASGNLVTDIQDSTGNPLTSSSGSLNVHVTNGLSTGAVDESAFIYGTSIEQPVGGVYQDTSPTLAAGETGAVRLTEYRAFHVNLRDSNGVEVNPATEATSTSILSALGNFNFSGGSLVVTTSGVVGIPINKYAENTTVPPGILTVILSYTVPAGKTLSITGAYGWGCYNGEYLIQVDGITVGGGWTSAAEINFHVDYQDAPIPATAGQVVTICVTMYSNHTEDFKANLLGTLN